MKNKKLLMTISAIMILIYHLWIYIFDGNDMEIFIKQICFIGVDIFFFLSAYSIGKNKIIDYKKFIKNRFLTVYLTYVIFSILAFVFNNWSVLKLLKVVFGIEFFEKGGGSFLWFVPALMILYLLLPLYKKLDDKYKIMTPCIFVIAFVTISVLASIFLNYKVLFIFTNRLPIILIGYYFAKYELFDKLKKNKYIYIIIVILLFIIGIVLSYITFINYVSLWFFKEVFYLNAIPLVLSIILIFNTMTENKFAKFLGDFTLEIYGIQMIFGFKIANYLYSIISNKLLTNILSISCVLIIALIANKLLTFIKKKLKKIQL